MKKGLVYGNTIFSKGSKNKHRYILVRVWDSSLPMVTVILSNPTEIANGVANDKTISSVCEYIQRLKKFGGIYFINLFSLCANSNDDLVKTPYEDRYNKRTDRLTIFAVKKSILVYALWGSNANKVKRINMVKDLLLNSGVKTVQRAYYGENELMHWSRIPTNRYIETIPTEDI